MKCMPATVVNYIDSVCSSESEPAFIHLDFNNNLLDYGGPVAEYVLIDLNKIEPVERQLLFLQGMLPCTNNPVVLERVQLSPGSYTEIHLLSNELGQWVIFIDTTIAGQQAQCEQQIRLSSELYTE